MNLAIEYFLRSGLAKDALKIPFSLYLNKIGDDTEKLVITVNYHKFTSSYLIKQWKVCNCRPNHLPPFKEHSIRTKDELFESPHCLIPDYELLNFKEQPYKCGILQTSDGIKGKNQEIEYQQIMDMFLNPIKHQNKKRFWLWTAFLSSHNLYLSDEHTHYELERFMELAFRQFKHLRNQFDLWKKHLVFETEVATELIFKEVYRNKILKELRQIAVDQRFLYSWPFKEPDQIDQLPYSVEKRFDGRIKIEAARLPLADRWFNI